MTHHTSRISYNATPTRRAKRIQGPSAWLKLATCSSLALTTESTKNVRRRSFHVRRNSQATTISVQAQLRIDEKAERLHAHSSFAIGTSSAPVGRDAFRGPFKTEYRAGFRRANLNPMRRVQVRGGGRGTGHPPIDRTIDRRAAA